MPGPSQRLGAYNRKEKKNVNPTGFLVKISNFGTVSYDCKYRANFWV